MANRQETKSCSKDLVPEDRLGLLCEFYEVFERISASDQLLQRLHELLPRRLGVDRATILLYDEKTRSLVAGQLIRVAPRDRTQTSAPQPIGYSISGICFATGKPIVIEDCRQTELIAKEWVEHLSLKSVIAVPIMARNKPVGVLRLDYTHRYTKIDPNAVEFHLLVGRQLGIIIEHARLSFEREQMLGELRASEERLALAVNSSSEGHWDWNLIDNRVFYSPRWKMALGLGNDEIEDSPEEWLGRVHDDDRDRLQSELRSHLEGLTPQFVSEHRLLHSDGSYRWMLARGVAIRDDESGIPIRLTGSQSDFTERKTAERRLVQSAFHDSLTGLPNRALLNDHLDRCIAHQQRRPSYQFALLFLDLDRFKVVNDSLGHAAGDELLVATARRLETVLRPGDTVARFGGDEYMMLLEDLQDPAEAVELAQRIAEQQLLPYSIAGQELFSTASIGIAYGTSSQGHGENLIRYADVAMYRAKALGRARYAIYDDALQRHTAETLQLETDLRRAIDREEFALHYQPIFSLVDGTLHGFEVLLRWKHPKRGLLSPAEFIPIAEEMGLIVHIGRRVLSRTCRTAVDLFHRFPNLGHLRFSVNLSARQFSDSGLPADIKAVLDETGLPAANLAVEITEGVLMQDEGGAAATLERLRNMGIEVHLDDFGTGYSSLVYLQRFPVDVLKIDQLFVGRMEEKKSNREIVHAIIRLARSLGMRVIAEGVINRDQALELAGLGCNFGQSYYLQRPIDQEHLVQWLESRVN